LPSGHPPLFTWKIVAGSNSEEKSGPQHPNKLGIPSTAYPNESTKIGQRDLKDAAICGSICAYEVRPHLCPQSRSRAGRFQFQWDLASHGRLPVIFCCRLTNYPPKGQIIRAEQFHEIETGRQ
jgi:hypothetical protein